MVLTTLNGTLEVFVDDILHLELMVSPNPPHKATADNDQYMHRADALDGTAGEHGVTCITIRQVKLWSQKFIS